MLSQLNQLHWGPSDQTPSPSPSHSGSLSACLRVARFACSSLADVALRASASALISVLSMTILIFLSAVTALSSPLRVSASFVVMLWSTLIVCGPGLPPSSSQGRPRFCFRTSSFFSFSLCGSCWPPDCDVQPLQLVRTWDRGNYVNPRHPDFFRSVFVSVPLRQLRCNSLHVHCGSHSAKLSRKAVSHSIMDSRYPRGFLACQGVVSSLVLEQAALTHPVVFGPESQPSPGRCLPCIVRLASLVQAQFRPMSHQLLDRSWSGMQLSQECPGSTRVCAQ